MRIVIADDQGMVRAGLRSLLEGEPDLEVVAEAADGEQAVAAVRRHRPDVVLMDIRMPHVDGIAATRTLMADDIDTRVLILTTFDLEKYVFDALVAGASGFLLKDATAEDLITAVRVVASGNGLLSPSVTRRVIETFAALPKPDGTMLDRLGELSGREVEVLRLLASGCSNAAIAAELILGEATVKTHVSNVFSKLGLRDRVQAVIFAYEAGLIRPSGDSARLGG
jgi:DNA-binding NarL/FixJ family response regulator